MCSVSAGYAFFAYRNEADGHLHSRLELHRILEIICDYLYSDMFVGQTCFNSGLSKRTVVEWFHNCQAACGKALESLPLLVGSECCPVQVDEARLQGLENTLRAAYYQETFLKVKMRLNKREAQGVFQIGIHLRMTNMMVLMTTSSLTCASEKIMQDGHGYWAYTMAQVVYDLYAFLIIHRGLSLLSWRSTHLPEV